MKTPRVNYRSLFSQCILCFGHCSHLKGICAACINDLPINTGVCIRCGHALDIPAHLSPSQPHCHHCASNTQILSYIQCPWLYQFPVQQVIPKAKYQQTPWLVLALAEAATTYFTQCYHQRPLKKRPQALLAMPMYPQKESSRGFNQASLICDTIAAHLELPIVTPIVRTKEGIPQAQLTRDKRLTNLDACFELTAAVKQQRIAIIDDVITTGASMNAVANALTTENRLLDVEAWALALTPYS